VPCIYGSVTRTSPHPARARIRATQQERTSQGAPTHPYFSIPLKYIYFSPISSLLVPSTPQKKNKLFGFTRSFDLAMKIHFKTIEGKMLHIPSRTNLGRYIVYHSRLSTLAANSKTHNGSIKIKIDRQVYPSQNKNSHSFLPKSHHESTGASIKKKKLPVLRKSHHESTGVPIAKTFSSSIPTKARPWIDRCVHRNNKVRHSFFYEKPTLTTRITKFDQQVYPKQNYFTLLSYENPTIKTIIKIVKCKALTSITIHDFPERTINYLPFILLTSRERHKPFRFLTSRKR